MTEKRTMTCAVCHGTWEVDDDAEAVDCPNGHGAMTDISPSEEPE